MARAVASLKVVKKRPPRDDQVLLPSRTQPKVAASLMEQAYSKIRKQILSCRLEPGSEISEIDIADRLSISKTPVREALGRLRLEGFVRAIPRRGYQITPLTISDMNELFDTRAVVEGGTIALAASRITDEQLNELLRLADASYDKETASTLDAFISTNRDFHIAIAKASNNQRLIETTVRQLDELERYFYVGARLRDVNNEVHADHYRIVEVLKRRDAALATQIIVEHNEATRNGLIGVIASNRHTKFMGVD
jgi:DNA-binding GntR family transcriptional regulator